MTTKFGCNRNLIHALSTMPLWMQMVTRFSFGLVGLSCVLCFWFAFREDRTFAALSLVFSVIDLISFVIAQRFIRRGEHTAGVSILMGTLSSPLWLFLLARLMKIEDVYTFTTVCFIVSLILCIGYPVLLHFSMSGNRTVIANARQGYLELTSTHICGVHFSDIGVGGSGEYFELPYADCRRVQFITDPNGGEPYCNLTIHHKDGTYWLSIDNAKVAAKNIDLLQRCAKTDNNIAVLMKMGDNVIICDACQHIQRGDHVRCTQCGAVLDFSE